MKPGDLVWVHEGSIPTFERPVIYLGLDGRAKGAMDYARPYHKVSNLSGGTTLLADYYYTLSKVE